MAISAQHAAGALLQAAVRDYFDGERTEMLSAIKVFMLIGTIVTGNFLSSRTSFAMGLMLTLLLFGGIIGVGLATLIVRDSKLSVLISEKLQTPHYPVAVGRERTRVQVVLSKFRYYRFAAGLMALLAVAGWMLTNRDTVHGVAVGLLIIVCAQVVIDHFSERRAQRYFAKLKI